MIKKSLLLLAVIVIIACPGGNMAEEIILPQPVHTGVAIEDCLADRRSVRSFTPDSLTTEQVATLLWAAQGITDTTRDLRAAPSAGATYPLEVYLFNKNGIYLYHPDAHKLTLHKKGDKRAPLTLACLGQAWVGVAPCSIVLCAVPGRTARRYGDRAMRYIWMEAGHAAENVLLTAVALGLGGVPIGAFHDETLADLLGLDAETIPLYVLPVGVPANQ